MSSSPLAPESYTSSWPRRRRVLFSPLRLLVFAGSLGFAAVMNVLYIHSGGTGWTGPVSVIPILAFLWWTMATDRRERLRDRAVRD